MLSNYRVRTLALPFVCATALMVASCTNADKDGAITASGTIEATDVNISSKMPGQITSLRAEEGTPVKIGDTIAILDHSSFDIQLKEAEAGIHAAIAQLALTTNGARSEDIKQTEEGYAQAVMNRDLAQQELKRMRDLMQMNATTQSVLDMAETRYKLAASQVAAADEMRRKVQHFARPEDIAMAHAHVDQLEATRERVAQMIRDCNVLAPSNGTVTHKVVESGEIVGAGSTIATVTDLSKVHLMIYVTETELAHVKLGAPVEVSIDGTGAKHYTGHVTYISPEAEFTPKNIQTKDDRTKLVFGVKVEIENTGGELKKGLPADAKIATTKIATK